MTGEDRYLQRLPIGGQLGHLEYSVTAEKLRLFRDAVGYPEAAFPNIAAREFLEVLTRKYGAVAADSVAHTDRYYRPPIQDRRVQVTGWVRDKYRQQGAERLVVETFAVDEIGTEILRSEHTFQFGVGRRAERLGRRPGWSRRGAEAAYLHSIEKRVTEENIEMFETASRLLISGNGAEGAAPSTNVHTGAALAQGMGLAGAVAPGELGLAYLHELLDRQFGIDFRQGGRLSVNYRRPIYAGDVLTAQGLVVKKEPAGERVNWQLQVWLENGRGEQVITGEARVTVPSPLT